jgi:hypothetical protein
MEAMPLPWLSNAELIALISESVAPTEESQDPWTEPKELDADCRNAPMLLVLTEFALINCSRPDG